MTKAVLNDIVNLENQTSVVNTINANNAVIETAFDNTLSRDGTTPNEMNSSLDMNSFAILNLPAPSNDLNPVRLIDLNTAILGPNANLSGNLTFPGTGGQTRSFLTSMMDFPSYKDWSNGTTAYNEVASLGGGTIFVPSGSAPVLPSSYDSILWDYLGPSIAFPDIGSVGGVGQVIAQRLFKVKPATHPTGSAHWAFGIDSQAVGSGTNGPGFTDGGLFISVAKQNWTSTTNFGELDGISVLVRNGGPDAIQNTTSASDASAYAGDVGIKKDSGFGVVMEAGTKVFNTDGSIFRSSSIQICPISSTPANSGAFGIVLGPSVGTMDDGILFGSTTAAPITNVIRYINSAGNRFIIDGLSQMFVYPNDGISTGFVKICNGSPTGDVEFVNSAGLVYFTADGATAKVTLTGILSAAGGFLIPPSGGPLDFSAGTTIYREPSDGSLTLTSQSAFVKTPSALNLNYATGVPAGGSQGMGLTFSTPSSHFGVYCGSGAPTMSAFKGSLYLRIDGSGTTNRMYINTDSSTTWTAVTTVA